MTTTLPDQATPERATLGGDQQSRREQVALAVFIAIPFLALFAAIPVAWGGWLGWTDVVHHGRHVLAHRARHHRRLPPALHAQVVQAQPRASRSLLAIAGSMAIQGPVVRWVADHRKHHKFSDRDGDPHRPWKYGTSARAR